MADINNYSKGFFKFIKYYSGSFDLTYKVLCLKCSAKWCCWKYRIPVLLNFLCV